MPLYKNVASQKIAVYARDTANDTEKTGDAANITAQISIDGGATAATNDTNPTELDATDAPGIYIFDMTQAETNGDMIILSPTSSTGDVQLEPVIIYTDPQQREVDLTHIMGTILTEGAGSRLANAFIKLFDVATPLLVASDVMRGTDSANTTTPPTTAAIATAVMGSTVDQTLDLTKAVKVILAMAAGDIGKSGDVYTYDEQDGTVILTETLTASAAARVIA